MLKERKKQQNKEYYQRPEVKERKRKYYQENKEKILKRVKKYDLRFKKRKRKYMRKYMNCYIKNRRNNDLNYATGLRLRAIVNKALKTYSKTGKIMSSRKYGIHYKKIIEHLKPFPKNVKEYHVDHIIPLSSFDLNNPEQIKKAFAPENHQWLTAEENQKKGSKSYT